MKLLLLVTLLAALPATSLASDPNQPHPNQGILKPILTKPDALKLTEAEQEKARHDFIDGHIKRFDTDGDGKVSYAEGWGAFNRRMVEMVESPHKAEL